MRTPPPLPTGSRYPWSLRVFLALGVLAITALVLFYPVENWRGKWAWEKCQQELAAKGEVLDWNAYMPPPIPDEQNVFKAPHMAEWFVGRGTNELVRRLDPENLLKFCQRFHTNVVLELSVVAPDEKAASQKADLVLRYDAPVLSREVAEDPQVPPELRFVKIPLIQFQDVPLRIAIENLARQAGLNYALDPSLKFGNPNQPEPEVTFKWHDVTALQALITLLNTYDLQWVENSKPGVALVTQKKSDRVRLVYTDSGLQTQIKELVQGAILSDKKEPSSNQTVKTEQGFEIALSSLHRTAPARVLLEAETFPNLKEVVEFFPTSIALAGGETLGLRVVKTSNGFQLLLSPPPFTAAEYLAWSDQFRPEFDLMREALKRPDARMEGDYQEPQTAPIPNFRTYRSVVRTLTQRAQCYLLLNQPDKAMRELTFMHKLSRSLECRPTSMVAVMTQAIISDLYVRTIADGLRHRTWREPHLTEIQDQLNQVNFLPLLIQAFRLERTRFPRMMEMEVDAALKRSWGLRLYPQGWLYQNYVSSLAMYEEQMGCLDATNGVVFPQKAKQFTESMTHNKKIWPYELFAYIAMPNFTRAIETAAFQQTQRDEALLACALERHRLAVGKYPDTIEALCPRFLEKVPHDIVGGQPLKYRREGNISFVLYSVGWNETDEHGAVQPNKDSPVERLKGDWVWESSENSKDRLLTAN